MRKSIPPFVNWFVDSERLDQESEEWAFRYLDTALEKEATEPGEIDSAYPDDWDDTVGELLDRREEVEVQYFTGEERKEVPGAKSYEEFETEVTVVSIEEGLCVAGNADYVSRFTDIAAAYTPEKRYRNWV